MYKINYLNAIVCCKDRSSGKWSFKKYRTIKNNHKKIKFIEFIKIKFKDVQYINFYCKETKQFVERVKL